MNAGELKLQNVSLRFGEVEVLRDVSFAIESGETVAIIGESGCGKTCCLKLLVGLLSPSAGEVIVGNRIVNRLADREFPEFRRRIGYLFQSAALFDSLTVFDNVAFGLRARGGVSHAEMEQRVAARLDDVGLHANTAAKMPAELSGGMRKRVGLARALALDPDVMLYDEPTTGLDPIMTDTINELLLKTRRTRKMTTVIVTHEMRTVNKVADRAIMLEPVQRTTPGQSQILYDGPTASLRLSMDSRVTQFIDGVATRLKETA